MTVRPTPAGRQARLVLVLATALTAAAYALPYGELVVYPLLLLSTYAHEMGHGLVGELVGGTFVSFAMYPDGSGVARTLGTFGRIDRALIAAGGLVGPSILAAFAFALSAGPRRARAGLIAFGALAAFSVVWVVRGWFGIVFVALVAFVCLLVGRRSGLFAQGGLAFFAVQLALSVFSRGDYLFTDVAQTGEGSQPSDVAAIAEALWLPYWVWGALCGLVSVIVLAVGLGLFWRGTRGPQAPRLELPPELG
jgi:hypothetical protein